MAHLGCLGRYRVSHHARTGRKGNQGMSKRKGNNAGVVARRQGWEWRVAAWAARHPLGSVAVPAAAGAGVWEWGAAPTACVAGGLVAGVGAWSRAHPASFDRTVGPWLRAQRRRWTRYLG